MINLVQYDPGKHEEEYKQINIELLQWYVDQLLELYNIDSYADIGQTVEEYVSENISLLTNLKPPEGVIYIVEIDGKIAGTGAVKRYRESWGEFKRMYIRPEFRGKGYSRILINKLFEKGNEFGWKEYILDTPPFSEAAHGLYRSVGFVERGSFPESEVPELWRPIWKYMEKTL
jgi:GNAT superfamily N-acetyltransferase